jgi:hypothetical protein
MDRVTLMNLNDSLIDETNKYWQTHEASESADGTLVFNLKEDLEGEALENDIQSLLFTAPFWNFELKTCFENNGYRCNVSSYDDTVLNRSNLRAVISKDGKSIIIDQK